MKINNKSNNPTAANQDYYQVVAAADNSSAEMLLYGVIGQRDWWAEDNSNDITDISFVTKLKELSATYSRINVRLNSPGGSVFHGNAIVTAIQNSNADVHVYNDGLCASMAAIIWAAGKEGNRHMAKNAVMMIHSPSSFAVGNAKDMRATADMLDIFEQTAIAVLANTTGKSGEEVKSEYFDYTDHWMSHQDVITAGLMKETVEEEYEVEDLVVTASERLTVMDIMGRFAQKGDEGAQNFINQLKHKTRQLVALTQKAAIFSNTQKSETDMNKSELAQALKEGKLTAQDVNEILASAAPAVAEPTTAVPAVDVAAEVAKQLQPIMEASAKLKEENETLKAKVVALGAKPGANPAGVASQGDTDPSDTDGPDDLDAFIAVTNAIANDKGTVAFR